MYRRNMSATFSESRPTKKSVCTLILHSSSSGCHIIFLLNIYKLFSAVWTPNGFDGNTKPRRGIETQNPLRKGKYVIPPMHGEGGGGGGRGIHISRTCNYLYHSLLCSKWIYTFINMQLPGSLHNWILKLSHTVCVNMRTRWRQLPRMFLNTRYHLHGK
jgi:hypothetical protein